MKNPFEIEESGNPLISVIVPAYNTEQYIEQCLCTIMDQSYKNLEIIVVNDGSTDETPAILERLSREDNRIKVVNQKNQGVAKAVITGFKNASGRYIGWVDSDDFIDSDMYEKLIKKALDKSADYVYCDYRFYPSEVSTKAKWFKPYENKCDWKYIERNSQRWKSLTAKDLLDKIDICRCFERYDEYGWVSVMLNARKTEVVYEELYNYRVGIQSLSGGSYKGKVEKFISGAGHAKRLAEIIPPDKDTTEMRQYFEYRYIYSLLQLIVVSAINNNRNSFLRAKRALTKVRYLENPLTKEILDYNHGKLKSFILRRILPVSYIGAMAITSVIYKD